MQHCWSTQIGRCNLVSTCVCISFRTLCITAGPCETSSNSLVCYYAEQETSQVPAPHLPLTGPNRHRYSSPALPLRLSFSLCIWFKEQLKALNNFSGRKHLFYWQNWLLSVNTIILALAKAKLFASYLLRHVSWHYTMHSGCHVNVCQTKDVIMRLWNGSLRFWVNLRKLMKGSEWP